MEKIINKILLIMKSSGLIETDDEIIRYGLEIVIMRGVFLILILVIGALMNCLIESIIFTVSYSVLRMYAGGCHAESRSKCFINSVLTLIIALIGIKAAEAYGFAAAALGCFRLLLPYIFLLQHLLILKISGLIKMKYIIMEKGLGSFLLFFRCWQV